MLFEIFTESELFWEVQFGGCLLNAFVALFEHKFCVGGHHCS